MAERKPPTLPMPASSSQRVSREIAAHLAELITRGELGQEDLLPSERELCEGFHASRSDVREALRSLQSLGYISLREKRRAVVSRLDTLELSSDLTGAVQYQLAQLNGVADFQKARLMVESEVARIAATDATEQDIRRIADALARNRRAMHDPHTFAATDAAFHKSIAAVVHNPFVTLMSGAIAAWVRQQRNQVLRAPMLCAAERAFEGHEAIHDAIVARCPEAAVAAMVAHLTAGLDFHRQAMALKSQADGFFNKWR